MTVPVYKVGDEVVITNYTDTGLNQEHLGLHLTIESLNWSDKIADPRFMNRSHEDCVYTEHFYLVKSCIRHLTPLEKALK